ncbi:ATP-binding protein [Pseudonocardia saturnea]|uniref:ATP-binding protein n=1 Tax=Pseudonocardia saturnea TaxID=33909 RepID=UPI0022B25E63|nr:MULTISPECIES: hypothetical protein [Pseudonocardia]
MAGADGNAVHLFERECSVQRRGRQVVEILPAPTSDGAAVAAALTADHRCGDPDSGERGRGTL